MPGEPNGLPPVPPGVRTTRRRGRTSSAKVDALRTLGPRWTVPSDDGWNRAAVDAAFGRHGRLAVDIGVGDGAATRSWASSQPGLDVLAIELHRPGIAKLLTDLDRDGPGNVRVVEADALEVLRSLEPGAVHVVRLLFPDPWPKRRHVARRMVDRAFVADAARVLAAGGELHLATDWPDYAEHMRTMVATSDAFEVLDPARPIERQCTAYERRGLAAGRPISDLTFRRRP